MKEYIFLLFFMLLVFSVPSFGQDSIIVDIDNTQDGYQAWNMKMDTLYVGFIFDADSSYLKWIKFDSLFSSTFLSLDYRDISAFEALYKRFIQGKLMYGNRGSGARGLYFGQGTDTTFKQILMDGDTILNSIRIVVDTLIIEIPDDDGYFGIRNERGEELLRTSGNSALDTFNTNFASGATRMDTVFVHSGIVMRGDNLPTPGSATYPFIEFNDNQPNRSFIQGESGHNLNLGNNIWRNPYDTTAGGVAKWERHDSIYTYGSALIQISGGSQGYNIDRDSTKTRILFVFNAGADADTLNMRAMAAFTPRIPALGLPSGLIISSDYDSAVGGTGMRAEKALDIRGSTIVRDTANAGVLLVDGTNILDIVSDSADVFTQVDYFSEDSLDIYLPLKGNAKDYAPYKGYNDGTVVGATFITAPDSGGAIGFNADGQYVTLSAMSPCTSYSISVWVRPTKDDIYKDIFISKVNFVTGIELGLKNDNHILMYQNSVLITSTSNKILKSEGWVHIAITYNYESNIDSTLIIYKNGSPIYSVQTKPPAQDASSWSAPQIGASNTTIESWIGQIKNFRFTSGRVLSAAEILNQSRHSEIAKLNQTKMDIEDARSDMSDTLALALLKSALDDSMKAGVDTILVHSGILMRGDYLPTPLSATYPFIELADNQPNRSFLQSESGHQTNLSNNYWKNPYDTTSVGKASGQRLDSTDTYGSVLLQLAGGSQGYTIGRDSTKYNATWWYNKDGATPVTLKALARWDFWKRGLIITSDYDSSVGDEHPTKALDVRGSIIVRDTLNIGNVLSITSADTTVDVWLYYDTDAVFDSLIATRIYTFVDMDSVNIISHRYTSVDRDTVVKCISIYHTDLINPKEVVYGATFDFPIPSDFIRFDDDSAICALQKSGRSANTMYVTRKASILGFNVTTVDSGFGRGEGGNAWIMDRADKDAGGTAQDLNSVSWTVRDKLILDVRLYGYGKGEYYHSAVRIRYKRNKF